MNAEWRWDFAIEILPNMLWATLNTILAAGIGYAIAAIVGLLFLLGQRTPIKICLSITVVIAPPLIFFNADLK